MFFKNTPLPTDISASNSDTELIKKKKKNPYGQLIWDEITFQTSICHSFPLKPGCVINTPIPVTLSASN